MGSVSCSQCDKEYAARSGLTYHIQTQHQGLCTEECPTCGQGFESERAMKIHHKNSHGETIVERSFECERCGEVVETSDDVSRKTTSLYQLCYLKTNTGSDNPNWRGGQPKYYGENWIEMRQRVRDRDGNVCQNCGKGEEELGFRPHVHHIQPVRTFDEIEKAHTMDNMIQLCASCHQNAENGNLMLPEVA